MSSDLFAILRLLLLVGFSIHMWTLYYMIVCIFDVKYKECRPAVVFGRYGSEISIRHGMDRNTPMKCLRIQDCWRKQKREKKDVVWKSLGRDIAFPFMVACSGSISLPPCYERLRESCAAWWPGTWGQTISFLFHSSLHRSVSVCNFIRNVDMNGLPFLHSTVLFYFNSMVKQEEIAII